MGAATNDVMRGLVRELSVLDLDAVEPLGMITTQLREGLGAESAILFTPRPETRGHRIQDIALAGKGSAAVAGVRSIFDSLAADEEGVWTLYDPRRVESAQQNRVFRAGSFATSVSGAMPKALARAIPEHDLENRTAKVRRLEPAYRLWGMRDAHHLRALVCDGPRMIAYVAALQADPFRPAEQGQLTSIMPALKRRLLIQERLSAPSTSALVPAILEELPTAAFVLDARDRVVACNRAGAARAQADARGTASGLRQARALGGDARYAIVDLATRGVARHALAIEHPSGEATPAVSTAQSRFGWTRREAEVAEHIAAGRTNRTIAVRLQCSERTVETHVSRLLGKSDCPSRSALTALLWSMAGRR